jgi:hypothetical protein
MACCPSCYNKLSAFLFLFILLALVRFGILSLRCLFFFLFPSSRRLQLALFSSSCPFDQSVLNALTKGLLFPSRELAFDSLLIWLRMLFPSTPIALHPGALREAWIGLERRI